MCPDARRRRLYNNDTGVGIKVLLTFLFPPQLVPVTCTTCRKNFCLKHRFETDHDCQGHPHRLGGGASTRKVSGGGARRPGGGSGGRVGGAPQKTAMSKIGAELNR